MDQTTLLTVGPIARMVSPQVLDSHIRAAARKGLIPFRLLGRTRVFSTADLPAIRAGLVQGGYLKDSEVVHASR